MSGLLGKLFATGPGGKGAGKGPSPQEAIQRLRDTEEMLSKKQEFFLYSIVNPVEFRSL